MGESEKETLTKLELQIMQVIWKRGTSNVSAVQEELEQLLDASLIRRESG